MNWIFSNFKNILIPLNPCKRIAELGSLYEGLRDQYDGLYDDVRDLEDSVRDIQSALADKLDESDFNYKYEELDARIDDTNDEIDIWESDISDLEEKFEDVQTELTFLTIQNAKLRRTIKLLAAKTNLEAEIEQILEQEDEN